MANKNACILAGGMSRWGIREASLIDLFQEAAKDCLDQLPNLKPKDIDGLLASSAYSGRCSFQVNLAPVVAERCGLKPTSICARVDVLCAGGSTAIMLAKALVESGNSEIIMVAGGEKLYTPQKWEVFYSELASIDHDWDAPHGLGLPPPYFAMIAKEHMKHYGTTKEQLARVSVANYFFGHDNPKAQMQRVITMEDALKAPSVVPPLTLYDCCPITDGASACIIASEEKAKELTDKPLVYLRGCAQVSQHSVSANFPGQHLGDWPHLKCSAEKAFRMAKLSPKDIDVAQVHDCFTISQIIEAEEIGFCRKGEGGSFIQSGQTEIGGTIPINTDGGLLSVGHPFGATGIRQGTEIMRQLQGTARHQVKDAFFGLTHNLSGLNTEQTVIIYGREPVK